MPQRRLADEAARRFERLVLLRVRAVCARLEIEVVVLLHPGPVDGRIHLNLLRELEPELLLSVNVGRAASAPFYLQVRQIVKILHLRLALVVEDHNAVVLNRVESRGYHVAY